MGADALDREGRSITRYETVLTVLFAPRGLGETRFERGGDYPAGDVLHGAIVVGDPGDPVTGCRHGLQVQSGGHTGGEVDPFGNDRLGVAGVALWRR